MVGLDDFVDENASTQTQQPSDNAIKKLVPPASPLDIDIDTVAPVVDEEVVAPVVDEEVAVPVVDEEVAAAVVDEEVAAAVVDEEVAAAVVDEEVAVVAPLVDEEVAVVSPLVDEEVVAPMDHTPNTTSECFPVPLRVRVPNPVRYGYRRLFGSGFVSSSTFGTEIGSGSRLAFNLKKNTNQNTVKQHYLYKIKFH